MVDKQYTYYKRMYYLQEEVEYDSNKQYNVYK
jgi:hypothetical protein